jgi:hypothetical protein
MRLSCVSFEGVLVAIHVTVVVAIAVKEQLKTRTGTSNLEPQWCSRLFEFNRIKSSDRLKARSEVAVWRLALAQWRLLVAVFVGA